METLYAMTLGTSFGGSGYTRRHVIAAGSLLATANTVRVLFHASATPYTITDAYIGLQATSGDAYDIDPDTIVRLTQDASTTFSISTGNEYSDEVSLDIDGTRAVVISLYGGSSMVYLVGTVPAGDSTYHRLGNYAAVTDASSFTATTINAVGFRGLEGYNSSLVSIAAALVGLYGDAEVISAALIGKYSFVLEVAMRGIYGDAPVRIAGLVGRYGNAPLVRAALVGRYGEMIRIAAALQGRYDILHEVVAGLLGEYAITGTEIMAALDGRYDLKERDAILSALEGYYSLLPGTLIQQLSFVVLIGGVVVDVAEATWTESEDSYLVEATITLRDPAQWSVIAKQDTVQITWMGTTWELFVAAKLRSRSISGGPGSADYGADYTVVARSLTAALDSPYALPVTMSWSVSTLASQIAADLVGSMLDLIALDFQLEDWIQPGGTFFVTDQSPLDGLRSLVALVGGIIQTGPGNHLILRMEDPIPPASWGATSPTWTIEDSGVFSDSETEQASNQYNVITVTNQAESSDSTSFTVEDITEYRKRVKGFRVPWVDFSLATSGGSWVTIDDLGVLEEQVVEEVEFVDGSASASSPIYSQVQVVWNESSLGAVTGAEDGTLTAAVAGCSRATITYTTKYHAWIGASNRDETVQFYQVEI